jgi:hypothetical protein
MHRLALASRVAIREALHRGRAVNDASRDRADHAHHLSLGSFHETPAALADPHRFRAVRTFDFRVLGIGRAGRVELDATDIEERGANNYL